MREGTPSGFKTISTGVPSASTRHILGRKNPREHAFVAVPSGHLVAHLQAALDRDEHLDHFDHAGRQFVAGLAAARSWPRNGLHRLDIGRHRASACADFGMSDFVFDP